MPTLNELNVTRPATPLENLEYVHKNKNNWFYGLTLSYGDIQVQTKYDLIATTNGLPPHPRHKPN